ncbi:DHH family phosphoesterase [Metabacillus malikii]
MSVHLYSHNDLDGVSCGILAKYAFKEKVQVQYLSVNRVDYQVADFLTAVAGYERDYTLYITDVSVNRDNEAKIEAFVQKGGRIQLIDHHKTALTLNQYKWGLVTVEDDIGKKTCATSLFYHYLVEHGLIEEKPVLDEYVELVRLYDTWDWEKQQKVEAKRLNDLLYMQSIEDFEESMLERLTNHVHFTFDGFEERLLDLEEKKTERYIKRKRRELVQTNIGNLCLGIVHAESYHSELGNALGKDNPHLDCIAIMNMGSKKIGFRTIHDHIDVSDIAGKYGGGGHAKAAGCTLTKEAFKVFIDKPFQIKPLKEDAKHNQINIKGYCALFENRDEDFFLVYQRKQGEWLLEKNHKLLSHTSTSFTNMEHYIKRTYQVGLAHDDKLIEYLLEGYQREQKNRQS